jgi:hypothetical protein
MADTAELGPAGGPASLSEAREWVGFALDEADGAFVGRVHSVYVDGESGEPSWLVVALEHRRLFFLRGRPTLVAVPARDCAGAAGRAWAAHPHGSLRGAPIVDPGRPLLREHELAICAHYGIGERVGRAAEVAGRSAGSVTSQPA